MKTTKHGLEIGDLQRLAQMTGLHVDTIRFTLDGRRNNPRTRAKIERAKTALKRSRLSLTTL